MAITKDRVLTTDMTQLAVNDYLTATDTTKDTPPNTTPAFKPTALSSKISNKIGKRNAFSDVTPPITDNKDKALGMYGLKDNISPANLNNVVKKQDDRSLSMPDKLGSYITDASSIKLNTVLSQVTAGLPEPTVTAIENMLNTQIANNSRLLSSVGTINKNAHLLMGINSIKKSLSSVGATTGQKKKIYGLLKCKELSGLNGSESALINNAVSGGLLSQTLCLSVTKFKQAVTDMVAAGINIKGDILKSVIESYANNNNKTAAEKTALLADVGKILGGVTSTDIAMSSPKTASFFSTVANGMQLTKDPKAEFINLVNGAATLDPNWNKDVNGNINAIGLKDNLYVKVLNDKYIKTDTIPTTGITANPAPVTNTDKLTAKALLAVQASRPTIKNSSDIQIKDYVFI